MTHCAALVCFVRMKWVVQNIESLTAYEADEPYGHGHLQIVREVSPHLQKESEKYPVSLRSEAITMRDASRALEENGETKQHKPPVKGYDKAR